MANNLNFNDQQNVKAALLEYEKDVKINGKFKIGTKKDEYIGNVAHIYDNVNDNEEQVFVLTKIQSPILLQMKNVPKSMT